MNKLLVAVTAASFLAGCAQHQQTAPNPTDGSEHCQPCNYMGHGLPGPAPDSAHPPTPGLPTPAATLWDRAGGNFLPDYWLPELEGMMLPGDDDLRCPPARNLGDMLLPCDTAP